MFEYIIGNIVKTGDDYLVLESNNIGYRINTSYNSLIQLEGSRENQKIITSLHIREDGMFLYGFSSEEEMEMFNMLLKVSKIGPKIAIGILSILKPNTLKKAILNKDVETLSKAPGIGKKTAERMVLELKDKIDDSDICLEDDEISGIVRIDGCKEAIEALMSLGYSKFEVEKIVRSFENEKLSVENIIRESLKKLSKS